MGYFRENLNASQRNIDQRRLRVVLVQNFIVLFLYLGVQIEAISIPGVVRLS